MRSLYILLLLFLIGCGSNSTKVKIDDNSSISTIDSSEDDSYDSNDTNEDTPTPVSIKEGKVQLGVIADATVKIYELNGTNRTLIATEITSKGDTIDTIGNFNLHLEKLDSNKFYIYEVSEGEDYDVEDDGIINITPTLNRGVFHLIAKGSSIKDIDNINITIVSEILYQKVLPFINSKNRQIEEKIDIFSKELIKDDIDEDGIIGFSDILNYNPINNKSKLSFEYQTEIRDMINNILNGRAFNNSEDIDTTSEDTNIINADTSTINENTNMTSDNVNTTNENTNITSNDVNTTNEDINTTTEDVNTTAVDINITREDTSGAGINYPKTEGGIQEALDNTNYDYVISELINNRSAYSGINNDEVNMNIAAAYVGKSGYTVFDVTSAMENSNSSTLNGFISNITKDNDAVKTIDELEKADSYYSNVVNGVDCNNTTGLTTEQKSSCFNLGLVRLTSLSNSVKLLFGGDKDIVQKWADGVEINSTDDLNGNSVIDSSDASACAIVYASNPNNSCRDGSMATYRKRVTFIKSGVEYNTTLIDVDVGSSVHGYNTFKRLVTNRSSNNSAILTNGVCDKNFNITTSSIDGVNYFPCPVIKDGKLMNISDSLSKSSNIQNLFPAGSETKTTIESYVENITGSKDGVINQDNLSTYLQSH